MTYKEYKKLGMHWSILEEAQRPLNKRLDLIKLLDDIGMCRRLWGNCETIKVLWDCYWFRKEKFV